MRRRSPASGRGSKAEIDVAGQDQRAGQNREEQKGDPGRSGSVLPPQDGAEAVSQEDHEENGKEVSGEACKAPEEVGDSFHDAGISLILTLALAWSLTVCALGPQTAGWKHIAVAGGCWCALFGFSFWAARRWGVENGLLARTAFRESRVAIATIGFAAVLFGSPALLAIAPDILSVAIAGAGYADGVAVGVLRRRQAAPAANEAGGTSG